jgi:hypothetical protein
MKTGYYFIVLFMAIICVGLTVALIFIGQANQHLQIKLQNQQQALNQGILGQQAQQISSGVLQDMAGAAAGNSEIRKVLEKYGYHVSLPAPAGSTTKTETSKP